MQAIGWNRKGSEEKHRLRSVIKFRRQPESVSRPVTHLPGCQEPNSGPWSQFSCGPVSTEITANCFGKESQKTQEAKKNRKHHWDLFMEKSVRFTSGEPRRISIVFLFVVIEVESFSLLQSKKPA